MPINFPRQALKMNTDPKLISLANMLVLKQPALDLLKPELMADYPLLTQLLETQLKKYEARKRLLLPDLNAGGNETIAIFSDYSGESVGNYHTYSFLVCAWNLTGLFTQEMKKTRDQFGLKDKELEFKDMRMAAMRNALPAYLAHLDKYVPGLLCTIVIDKKLTSVFGPSDRVNANRLSAILKEAGFGDRKPPEAEKLLRVVHAGAYLASLLGREGQKIFWMTDHDAICANEDMHKKTLALFQNVIDIYARSPFSLIGGARPFTDKSVEFLDLLSITDLAAGTIEHYLTRRDKMGAADATVREGTDRILQWLGHDGLALKKLNIVFRPTADGMVQSGTIEFIPTTIPSDATFVSIKV